MRELKLIGTVMDTKCRLPFVSFGDANQIVGSPKIEVSRRRAWRAGGQGGLGSAVTVAILPGDAIEAAVVDRGAMRTVLLDEQDRGAGGGLRRASEVVSKVFV